MSIQDYHYAKAGPTGTANDIYVAVSKRLRSLLRTGERVLDLGCGNGHFTQNLAEMGFIAQGIDTSVSGIAVARSAYPQAAFFCGTVDALLTSDPAPFDAVVSIEVIEHCLSTREFCAGLAACVKPGGVAIVTTPYHGYFKNLAIALLGMGDRHYNPLWEGGHIKFFSLKTLSAALTEVGFTLRSVDYVGRIPLLAKSIVVTAIKAHG